MAVVLQPAALLAAPTMVFEGNSQTEAATHQGPIACILLLPATFPGLLPDVAIVVPSKPGPEPPGWFAAALLGTSRQPDPCFMVSYEDIQL